MPTWQARVLSALIRAYVRRQHWGDDERALARRARRRFGTPGPVSGFYLRGVRAEPVSDTDHRMFTPRGEWIVPPEARPGTVLYLHGGGYVACSPRSHRPVTAALARHTRRRVLSVDYRLAPEHRFPAAIDDAFAAYRWLVGRDAEPIAIAGDSAGGGLALAIMQRARDEGLAMPACGVAISPWTDLAGAGESQVANAERDAMFHPDNMTQFARTYLGDASPLDPAASPVYGDMLALPPLLLQVGSTEMLLDDARRVHERALAAGVVSHLEVFDDVPHGWEMLDGFVPEATDVLRRAGRFISTHLDG